MKTNTSAATCLLFSNSGVLRGTIFRLVISLFFLFNLASCDMKPEILVDGGSVNAESYMWCLGTTFDQKWSLVAGVLVGTQINPPINIPSNIFTRGRPFPSEFRVRWFHFGEQKFYEANLTDPALQEKAFAFVKRHNAFNYDKQLYVSIYDSGKVEFWFGLGSEPTREKKHIELLGSIQGFEVEGDASAWAKQTMFGIREGWLPASVLDTKK